MRDICVIQNSCSGRGANALCSSTPLDLATPLLRLLGAFLRASLSHTGPSCEKLCSSSRSTIEIEKKNFQLNVIDELRTLGCISGTLMDGIAELTGPNFEFRPASRAMPLDTSTARRLSGVWPSAVLLRMQILLSESIKCISPPNRWDRQQASRRIKRTPPLDTFSQ